MKLTLPIGRVVMAMSEVKWCSRCVMNNAADETIRFDKDGVCNYCTDALRTASSVYHPGKDGEQRLDSLVEHLKEKGVGKRYDCIMGLSGGLDSSYLAYLGAEKWGLRIAAVHIDDGYDTEISTANIAKLCDRAGIELVTIAPDKEQFNALTLAYMKAGVPNIAVPQDNILFSALYSYARREGISTFLSGGNFSLECILQNGNTWDAYDLVNLRDISRRFNDQPTDKLSFLSHYRKQWDRRILGQETLRPLNLIDYRRDSAFAELKEYCGFEYYGRKHLENYLTAFAQLCWLPEKFGVDKRTSHLSSMIISGQMSREEALRELEEPLCSSEYMEKVKHLLCENMQITRKELEALVAGPGHQHDEYRTDPLLRLRKRIAG